MKQLIYIIPALLVLLGSGCQSRRGIAHETAPPLTQTYNVPSGFRHPGIYHTVAMLESLKDQLAKGDKQKVAQWNDMRAYKNGQLENMNKWAAPTEIVGWQNYNLGMAGGAANSFALQWIVTGDVQYAEAAIELIRHWSNTLMLIRSEDGDPHDHKRLIAGIHCGYWANAGELLRCSNAPWPEADQQQFEKLLRDVFLPAMQPRPNHFNGNWDLAIIKSTMAIAIFLDDRPLFDAEIERLKGSETNGSITNYLLPSGQCQETGRDQTHAQMGLGFLAQACEIAWNQGIDLYEFEDRSLGRCFEYLSRYNLGDDEVPFEPYPSPIGENAHDAATGPSDKKRAKYRPIYEIPYRHYTIRKKQKMPYTKKVIKGKDIERTDAWTALTFSNIED